MTISLRGYKLSTIEISDENFLAKDEASSQLTLVPSNEDDAAVEGTVFEISTDEVLVADMYEPAAYARVKAKLQSGKQAWVYLAA